MGRLAGVGRRVALTEGVLVTAEPGGQLAVQDQDALLVARMRVQAGAAAAARLDESLQDLETRRPARGDAVVADARLRTNWRSSRRTTGPPSASCPNSAPIPVPMAWTIRLSVATVGLTFPFSSRLR